MWIVQGSTRHRDLRLASADIHIVLVTIVWCMVAFRPYSWVASVALMPYLVWVCTATVLQLSIMRMNRHLVPERHVRQR